MEWAGLCGKTHGTQRISYLIWSVRGCVEKYMVLSVHPSSLGVELYGPILFDLSLDRFTPRDFVFKVRSRAACLPEAIYLGF